MERHGTCFMRSIDCRFPLLQNVESMTIQGHRPYRIEIQSLVVSACIDGITGLYGRLIRSICIFLVGYDAIGPVSVIYDLRIISFRCVVIRTVQTGRNNIGPGSGSILKISKPVKCLLRRPANERHPVSDTVFEHERTAHVPLDRTFFLIIKGILTAFRSTLLVSPFIE